mmetsp:Transcript_56283/g.163206  ORF Transcript_56283/g.163206 Transcript_56283/m.163206 type:complete len:260 (-) Transcript_56283:1365-2144(-)
MGEPSRDSTSSSAPCPRLPAAYKDVRRLCRRTSAAWCSLSFIPMGTMYHIQAGTTNPASNAAKTTFTMTSWWKSRTSVTNMTTVSSAESKALSQDKATRKPKLLREMRIKVEISWSRGTPGAFGTMPPNTCTISEINTPRPFFLSVPPRAPAWMASSHIVRALSMLLNMSSFSSAAFFCCRCRRSSKVSATLSRRKISATQTVDTQNALMTRMSFCVTQPLPWKSSCMLHKLPQRKHQLEAMASVLTTRSMKCSTCCLP